MQDSPARIARGFVASGELTARTLASPLGRLPRFRILATPGATIVWQGRPDCGRTRHCGDPHGAVRSDRNRRGLGAGGRGRSGPHSSTPAPRSTRSQPTGRASSCPRRGCVAWDSTRLRPGTIALPRVESERIAALAWTLDARIDAPVGSPAPVDEDALELTRLALLLPAALAIPVPPGVALDAAVLSVFRAAIRSFRQAQVRDLRIVAPAPVPLEGALGTEFVVFSGGEGLRDLVAILVGRPDLTELVAVRLHSACLTGDLFGSLSLAASATSGRPNTGAATYCSPRSP